MSKIEITYLRAGNIFRPMIPIWISNGKNSSYLSQALLDSGSDYNLFPARLGEIVGLDIKSGRKAKVIGIGAGKMTVYQHSINLHLGREKFNTYADFSFEQDTPLLGRQGFFNLFKRVDFNENKHKVTLRIK